MKSKHKNKAFEEIFKSYIEEAEKYGTPSIRALLELLLDTLMKAERDVSLKDRDFNKANGYYQRSLNTGSFKLDLNIPRDRNGEFRPVVLPDRWKRSDLEYQSMLISLIANGYSPAEVRRTLKHLGLSYAQEDMEQIRLALEETIRDFKKRELKEEWLAIFIDAYDGDVKEENRVRQAQVYLVLGLDLDGRRDLSGFYVVFGREKKSTWLEIFRDLISRGLKRVLLVVSDDFRGLREAVGDIFPYSDHQLCYVHLMRNIRKDLSKEDAAIFIHALKRIKEAPSYEMG